MFSREKNFFGGHGIVGAQASLGTGLAFAHKYKETGGLCVSYLGDGALNQGQVYESFNMAALWKLPVIYVIENNQYAMGTSVERSIAGKELHKRGEAYGIPSQAVDGMNIFAVRKASMEAVQYVKEGHGPYILELQTYRYRGHSMSDPAKYRSKEEVERMREDHDPIEHLAKRLLEAGIATENELKDMDQVIKTQVLEAMEFGRNSPEPDTSELYTDVLIEA
jgi:pyruvate dehydrogenase E1 component alpha subunit